MTKSREPIGAAASRVRLELQRLETQVGRSQPKLPMNREQRRRAAAKKRKGDEKAKR